MTIDSAALWEPDPARTGNSALREYLNWLEQREGRQFLDHAAFWAWSVAELDRFWTSIVEYFDVEFSAPPSQVRTTDPMPHTRWFPGARCNWAQQLLRPGADIDLALLCVQEGGSPAREITYGRLRRDVAAAAGWLRRAGVGPGDRVAAYLPNTEHAVIACLATASVGAIWACCSPDFGVEGVIGRLAQLQPTVLIAADGYHWNGKQIDRRDVVTRLRANLPSVRHFVGVAHLFPETGDCTWTQVVGDAAPERFEQVEFSHPLWVLFTSGTTGLPKGLVHSHGGITVENLKWAGLYAGLRPGERCFTYTSTGWVLWNMLVAALSRGATAVLYEGSPAHPDLGALWEVAARTHADVMFLGAALITATQNSGISPGQHDLSRLRTLMVSGSALPTEGYHWAQEHVSPRMRLDSTSGGTDVCTAFVGGNDLSPVWAGRISGAAAGVAVAAWDDTGTAVIGAVGELVVTEPMPSMPLYLWNDPDGSRYQESYFDPWPGVWRHGDWITAHPDGTYVIHGRSDATLNRGGVRLGSAEFYDVVEPLPQVREALVVGIEEPEGGYWLGLFLAMAPDHELTDALRSEIVATLRTRLSNKHVPDAIVAVPAIPHTLSGKKLEVPVKRLLAGHLLEQVANPAAIDNPEALAWFARFATTRH